MFRLHETTRRRSCRTAFVLVCLAPLVAIGGLGAFQRMPLETALHQRQLGEQLGLRAKFARVEHPRPGVTRYVGLELADPETGQVVFRAKQMELTLPMGRPTAGHFASGQIVLVEPQIELDGTDSLRQLLLRALRRELNQHDVDWRVSAETVEINTRSGRLSWINVSGGFAAAAAASQAWIQFHPAQTATSPQRSAQRAYLQFVRNREGELPYTGLKLYTHGAELPCDPFLQLIGIDARLGAKCRFRGYSAAIPSKEKPIPDVAVLCDDVGWGATIHGGFTNVDLELLAGKESPHTVEGRARLEVAWAEFRDGRLINADCSLRAENGSMSPSLVTSAIDELGLRGPKPPAGATDPIHFDQLAASVTLDSQGLLKITGDCGQPANGLVLSGSSGHGSVLLKEPAEQPQSVIGLVRMLLPPGEDLVPASQQAAALLQWLPLPAGTATTQPSAHRSDTGVRRQQGLEQK